MLISSYKQVLGWVLLFSLFAGLEVNAAGEIILNSSGNNNFNVIENTYSRLLVRNKISSFNTQLLDTDKGEFIELLINSYSKTNTIGSPQLPVVSKLIEIPEGSTPEVKVISYELREYKLADFGITQKLFPAQVPQAKNSNQKNSISFNKQVYEANIFYKEALVRVEVAGYLRGVQLANLILSPVEYNPVTNTIRVYDNLVVEMNFSGANQLKSIANNTKITSSYYKSVFSNVLNYQSANVKSEDISDVPVKYVIVSDPMFKDALQPFVKWKTKRGFNVIEAYTNNPAVGTSLTSIKTYLRNLYNAATSTDPVPTFVLIVGDVAQIPAFDCGDHVSDLYYCEYTGDYLPEVFYGRFSANTVEELLPQLNKTLQYEQYLMPDPSYLNEVVMVAGADASHQLKWGNGQVNYGTTYYFNEAHNLVSHIYRQPEPSGSNYSKSIKSNISQGVSFASYSAHGSAEGWANPTFTISDVTNLQNIGKYGLLVGNSCQTNAYEQNSFGETLLRAENKGAIGYIGSSGLTYWDEDYWWSVGNGSIVSNPTYENTGPGAYDGIFHDHGEPRSEWYSTMGQMVFAGNLAVQESNSEMKKQYWESYCLMGDPSTMIYFGVPPKLKAEYNLLIPLETSTFQIRTEPFASVAISKNNVLHGVAEADEKGLAIVKLQPFTEPGYANIVVTMQNRQPYIDSVKVDSPEGPYLAIKNVVIKDEEGTTNNLPESGELLTIDILIENLGNSNALNAKSVLSTTDNFLTITDDSFAWPQIAGNGSISAENAFKLKVSDNVPDLHKANYIITTQTESGTFRSDLNFLIFAPKPVNGKINFDDTKAGNGNRQIDPGETIIVTIPVTNSGHCISGELITQLFLFGDYVTSNSTKLNIGKLAPGETGTSAFYFTVSPEAKVGTRFLLYVISTTGLYNSVSSLALVIGTQPEDFETNDFLKYNWKFKGVKPWEISSTVKAEGLFGAQSGTINDSELSEMYLEGQVLFNDTISFYRKVSSENGYDFLKFFVDGIELGSWSGNKDWAKVSYPVSSGNHRLSWVYEKDEATSAGLDAVWIDYIRFPAFSQALKGKDAVKLVAVPETICEGEQSQLFMFTGGSESAYTYNWTLASTLSNSGIFNPMANPDGTTTYGVNVIGKSFAAYRNITVTVELLPATPYVSVFDDHLVSSSVTGNQWYNSQGMIRGATLETFFPPKTETYYVIATDRGCHSKASNEILFGFTENPIFDETRLLLFPNPFSGKLYVNYIVKSDGYVKIGLYNSTGVETGIIEDGNKSAGNHRAEYDGSYLAPGIYTCKIFSGSGVEVTKLVKK